jgi:hypothetical protein
MLNSINIKTKRPSKKLDWKRLGPFTIDTKISSHAYRLKLPKSMSSVHPVFHVSLLELHRSSNIPNRMEEPLPPVLVEGEWEEEVEAIVDSKVD